MNLDFFYVYGIDDFFHDIVKKAIKFSKHKNNIKYLIYSFIKYHNNN